MKSRRLVTGKMDNITACQGSNASSITLLKGARLADNNSSNNSTEDNNETFDFILNIDSPQTIVTLVLLSCFLCIVFFYTCRRRRRHRVSRPTGIVGLWQPISWETAQGLEPKVIESFPIFSYSVVKGLKAQTTCTACAICLAHFKNYEMLRLLPNCSHAFHRKCIDRWLSMHTTCPLCREILVFTGHSIPTDTDFDLVESQAPPPADTIVIDNGSGVILRKDISNDDSTKEMEQPMEWYMATGEDVMIRSQRSCSSVDLHHSEQPSCSNVPPACFASGDAEHRSKSEKCGRISVNSASVMRTCSERFSPRS
ncbi:hypothetical protein SUGI_0808050 [Cryptomeria japonica]|uniref:RING-H2 finger protein ATL40 n=1 Tax=Cryptomeria japonica TaxID=3369 RepID=UPI002414B792|nr:RING-H2 finger protein ATL40 [Cryptomeria japonica]GLJ39548.1 hypothetical protein SUGI_0808050 [Cryptomeria japonica]